MSPLVWRDEINYGGDPVTDVSLESFRTSIQPIKYDCTVSPSMYMREGDVKYLSDMVDELS